MNIHQHSFVISYEKFVTQKIGYSNLDDYPSRMSVKKVQDHKENFEKAMASEKSLEAINNKNVHRHFIVISHKGL